MQYCPKCKVHIKGDKKCCPLCQGSLSGEPEDGAFPVLRQSRAGVVTIMRICTFVFVIVEIAMAVASYLTGWQARWTGVIAITAFLGWVDLWIARYYRNNTINLITIQTYIGILVCLFIDHSTGGYTGWSLIWVVPCAFLVLEGVTALIGRIQGYHMVDYVIYLVADTLLSLLQLVAVANGRNPFPIPAVISVALLLIWGAFIIIFRGKDLSNAASKYLNR